MMMYIYREKFITLIYSVIFKILYLLRIVMHMFINLIFTLFFVNHETRKSFCYEKEDLNILFYQMKNYHYEKFYVYIYIVFLILLFVMLLLLTFFFLFFGKIVHMHTYTYFFFLLFVISIIVNNTSLQGEIVINCDILHRYANIKFFLFSFIFNK